MNGFLTGALCLILVMALAGCADRDAAARTEDVSPEVSSLSADSTSPALQDTSMVYEGEGFSIEIRYPQAALELPEIGDSLLAFSAGVEEPFRDLLAGRSPEEMDWSLTVYFSHMPSPRGLVCILASIYEYTGGAHAMNWDVSFVYDLEKEMFIAPVTLLGDSTAFAAFASAACDTLLMRFAGEFDAAWIESGTAPTDLNYQALLPIPDSTGGIAGFSVVFSPYQVAPYAYGSQEVLIRNASFEAGPQN
jgi:hypothetical protein